jgi:glycosyltransferase involved in cell wall biosynthesis
MNIEERPLPRTLIVDLSQRYGGASSRVLALLGKLQQDRSALACLNQGAITHRARELGIHVHTVGTSKADPLIPGRLARLIREHGYQLLDTQNVQSKLWGSLAAGRTGAALVSTINSWYTVEHGASMKGRLYQFIELTTNRNLDLYITVSSADRRQLLEAGIPQGSIEWIPNAVEVDDASIATDRAGWMRSFDLPEESFICCAVGRLVWAKGFEVLIEAIAQLAQKHPNLYCLIIGDGSHRVDLERQIDQASIQERIRLVGFRPPSETLAIVKSCNVFVMPSHSEGTPIALLEAAALGRPILASHVGGIPDLVSDGEQALLVPPGDVSALAAGLSRLIDDPQLATRLGTEAQRRVREDFSLQAMVEATTQAYRKAWTHRQDRMAKA